MLTPERIEEIVAAGVKSGEIPWAGFKPDAEGKHTLPVLSKMHIQLARAIEAEVRKDDEALIRQMLEALESQCGPKDAEEVAAIAAARARLIDSDLSKLTERGAKAWAGVDPQKLREGKAL